MVGLNIHNNPSHPYAELTRILCGFALASISFETGEYGNTYEHQKLGAQAGMMTNIFLTITGERLLPLLHLLY
jgi:hypothetical protein